MEYGATVITNAGTALMSKLLSGNKLTKFTKIVLSETKYSENQLANLTALSNIKATADATTAARNATNVETYATFNNEGNNASYTVNTIGVMAQDPDGGADILYSVTPAIIGGYVPTDNGVTKTALTFKVLNEVARASVVNMTTDPAGVATYLDLDRMKKPYQAWANSTDGKTDFTKVKPNPNLLGGKFSNYADWTFSNHANVVNPSGQILNGKTFEISGDSAQFKQWQLLGTTKNGSALNKVKIGDILTFSYRVRAVDDRAVGKAFQVYLTKYKNYVSTTIYSKVAFNLTKDWRDVVFTYTITATDLENSDFLRVVYSFEDIGKVQFEEPKIEYGTIATPNTVSSKIEDRYRAFPQYTGFSNKDSNDYRDYTWVRSDEAQAINYEAWASDKNGTNFSQEYVTNVLTNTLFLNNSAWIGGNYLNEKYSSNEVILTKDSVTTDRPQFTTQVQSGVIKQGENLLYNVDVFLNSKIQDISDSGIYIRVYTTSGSVGLREARFKNITFNDNGWTRITVNLPASEFPQNTDWTKPVEVVHAFGMGFTGSMKLRKPILARVRNTNSIIGYVSNPSEKSSDKGIFMYRGISNSPSTDYLDYVWDKSEQYRDAELQQIKTAIIALGGTV